MTRPYFLRRLSARVARRAFGVNREPVHHVDPDYESAALLLGFTAGAGAMGFAIFIVIVFYWRPTCGL